MNAKEGQAPKKRAKASTKKAAAEKRRKPGTVGARVCQLLTQKTPLTYDEIVAKVRKEFPEANTSKESVQWYASRLRREEGVEPNVKAANG